MITLTAEQAQQIEESLEDIVRVFEFETGTPVEALAAIRAARAHEQAEQDLDTCPGCGGVADNGHDREFSPNPYYCTKCSEQAEQEPVAEVHNTDTPSNWSIIKPGIPARTKLYAAQQPDYKALWEQMCKRCDELDSELAKYTEPEPVGVVEGSSEWGIAGVLVAGVPIGTKLYAAPVRTKYLTDDEIMKINVDTAGIVPTCDRQFHFARAVIDADREKNK